LLFDQVDRTQLAALGEVRTPSIADLFVAVMSPHSSRGRGIPARQADQVGAAQ
jgi:ABC-2 type transport system ATP-binding protein